MRSVLALFALSGIVVAQHVHLHIPEIESWAASMVQEFSHWTHGPSPTGPVGPRPTQPVPSPGPSCTYWLEDIEHQGIAAFNPSPSTYQVFRNVKDFGAKGDGVTDDTAAIQNAISAGARCAPGSCASTTTTPAVVYFPMGTYMISSPIVDYYYTQLIGNAVCLPTIKAFANFTGALGMIDGDPYEAGGNLAYGATNVFWRQIRNFILDMTLLPANVSMTGIHWPTAQATSIQNVVFLMSEAPGTQHVGVFIEQGSGGFLNDLVFYGGLNGMTLGNQQFTMRNLTFYNTVTAISQIWDWGWTYSNININNCSLGLNMSSGGPTAQSVGSITFIDSSITNTPIGIVTAHDTTSQPPTAGSLILENVQLNNVTIAVQGPNGVALAGSSGQTIISAWGEGHEYTPRGPTNFEGTISPNNRPAGLVSGNKFYQRSKPQYGGYPLSSFLSARKLGATGNGITDDTTALNNALMLAAEQGKILFLDAGDYRVTSTIYAPAGTKLVGESYSVILSSGSFFANISNPQPVVQIGKPGESGQVEFQDVILSTQGPQAGAILLEYNLASPASGPSGLWDVHARIGGFAGSNLQLAECPTTPNVSTPPTPINTACIAAFLTMHVTKSASGLYLENNWLWTADHDVEDPSLTQITIYTGRGMLVESPGPVWLLGTAVEHHALYQYQFAGAAAVFAGQIQTETAYYQPNPNATLPFALPVAAYSDPVFAGALNATNATGGYSIPGANSWGLRVLDSREILIYGAGLYSFFDNYNTTCSDQGGGEVCQTRIFSVESTAGSSTAGAVSVYNLNTVGTHWMLSINGVEGGIYSDNLDGFIDTIALFRS